MVGCTGRFQSDVRGHPGLSIGCSSGLRFVAVVQSDPDFSQFGHSLFLQVAIIEGEAHEAILTHAPIPLAAAAGTMHLLGCHR